MQRVCVILASAPFLQLDWALDRLLRLSDPYLTFYNYTDDKLNS